jgi:DNA-binding XRE family transcriptional regulator
MRRKPWAEVAAERTLGEKLEKAASQLRAHRLARKLSQKALAQELGVTANTVARWERCEVPIPHWVAPHQSLQEQITELKLALASDKPLNDFCAQLSGLWKYPARSVSANCSPRPMPWLSGSAKRAPS